MTALSCLDLATDSAAIPATYSFESAARCTGLLSGTTRLRRELGTTPRSRWSNHEVPSSAWTESASTRGSITFDRRRLPRKMMKGHAMAVFTQGSAVGMVVRVELVDASHTGLGIKCPIAIEAGASFSLIPEHAMMPRAVGVAVRCESADGGFHVGLRTRVGALAA